MLLLMSQVQVEHGSEMVQQVHHLRLMMLELLHSLSQALEQLQLNLHPQSF